MTVLAFLQNPWFKPGTLQRYIDMYRDDPEFRRRVLLLSRTGKMLFKAFGPEMYQTIVWDNANPRHGGNRRSMMKPDVEHMIDVLGMHDPDVIMLFGRQAQTGFDKILSTQMSGVIVLRSPHPSAMGNTMEELKKMANKLKKIKETI